MRQQKSKPSLHSLFPTRVYQAPCLSVKSRLFSTLLDEAQTLLENDRAGHKWSVEAYNNGYTSYGSLDQLHQMSEAFKGLQVKIDRHVKNYLSTLGLQVSPQDLYMSRLWLNVMPANCYHAWHTHPLSVISGTFYLQLPKVKAPIRFEDPRMGLFMNRPPLKSSKAFEGEQNFYTLQPNAGDVLLFESWLRHEVPMHQDLEPRVSVSFNYDWK